MRLFIAEKPSLGRAIAEGLGNGSAKSGCIVCGEDVVTWCFGHLLEQCDPEDYDPALRSWNAATLPIVPPVWKLKPRDKAADQLRTIGDLLRAAGSVVNAGDPDREGQLLVDEVLEHFGYRGPVQRIWLASLDTRSVAKALATLSDNTKHAPLRDAARARSQADWLVGLNATRAMTLLGRKSGRAEKVLSLGRVQTPTLALVVARDREIAAFRPVDYFVLQAQLEHMAGKFLATLQPGETQPGLDSEGRLVDATVATALAEAARSKPGTILNVSREQKKKPVPLPHCLSSLQKAASAKFGMSAQEVLDTAQSLYEKKLTTYPRTDCRYLPVEQFADASRVLVALGQVPELADVAAHADSALRGPVWDTKKITAHHAIIPTGEAPGKLTGHEYHLYIMIASAFALQFYPPMVYESQKISVALDETRWEAKGRLIIEPGWTTAGQDEDEDDAREKEGQSLPMVVKGDVVTCADVERLPKKTSPPSRFTEGTLIEAMANVHRFVTDAGARATLKENEGIGTEATRAGILETLKGRGYLMTDKKALVATPLGKDIIDLTPAVLKDPVTTAQWESRLAGIEAGTETLATFMAEQVRVLPDLLAPMLAATPKLAENAHPCPACGHALLRRDGQYGPYWSCSNYPACKTSLPDDHGKPGERKAEAAFTCPKCGGLLKHFKTKKGTMCFACFAEAHSKPLFWDDDGGKPKFVR